MRQKILDIVKSLDGVSNPSIQSKFIDWLNLDEGLTRETNTTQHLGTYFVPISQNKYIYLVHHIKADSWIPPGGHVDKGELPLDTVYREITEELDYTAKPDDFSLLDLSITDIDNKTPCKRHWDIWYKVKTPKLDFSIDPKEFYSGEWVTFKEALKRTQLKRYLPTYNLLFQS